MYVNPSNCSEAFLIPKYSFTPFYYVMISLGVLQVAILSIFQYVSRRPENSLENSTIPFVVFLHPLYFVTCYLGV